jgi:hypothetical protein
VEESSTTSFWTLPPPLPKSKYDAPGFVSIFCRSYIGYRLRLGSAHKLSIQPQERSIQPFINEKLRKKYLSGVVSEFKPFLHSYPLENAPYPSLSLIS